MKPLPASVDIRITGQDGRTYGLTYLDDGFASTVPCTHDGCYMPARLLVYDLSPGGVVVRRCNDHAPAAWLQYVRAVHDGMQSLPGGRDEND